MDISKLFQIEILFVEIENKSTNLNSKFRFHDKVINNYIGKNTLLKIIYKKVGQIYKINKYK